MAAPDYSVPALDKALDILELLAERAGALGQAQIAAEVDRTVGQVFRVLQVLEARGYLFRDPQSGLYSLSMRMFELAHRQEPVRGLVRAALGPMRELADAVGQSCNLGMADAGRILILAQVESPASFGFRVRVGAEFPLETTATGAVLRAFASESSPSPSPELDGIRAAGFVRRDDSLQPGITDIVFPVLGRDGHALAALTVPYVNTSFSASGAQRVEDAARAAAAEITRRLVSQNAGDSA